MAHDTESDALPFALRMKRARAPHPGGDATGEDLVLALLARMEETTAPRERACVLVEIAEAMRDQLADEAQAFDALVEAWRTDPTYDAIVEPLETYARTQGRFPELFKVTEGLVAQERDVARALALSEAMVRWLTREVNAPELAKHYLDRVRTIDPTHALVHLYQAAIYGEHGDVKRELEELDRAVLSTKRADDRARIHLLMAARYTDDRTANVPEAKKHFEAALSLRPTSMEALRGLEAIHTRAGAEDWSGLADVLEKQAVATPDEAEKERILVRLAELYEHRFLKPDVAAQRLERVFTMNPANTDALASLERCYRAARAWRELVSVFERSAVMLADDAAARIARLKAIAEVHESKLSDFEAARRAHERVIQVSSDDEASVAELVRLSEKIGDFEATVRWRTLQAELTPDPIVRARVELALGQLLAPADKDPAKARAHFEVAVRLDPTLLAAWNSLLWMARDLGDYARLAAYLEQRAYSADGPRLRGQYFAELAEIRAKELNDAAGSIAAYEAAREADPTNEAAAQALLDLYVRMGRWEEAAPLHEIAILAAERDQDIERRFALLRTGREISVALGLPAVALASASAAFDLRPTSIAAQAELIASAAAVKDDPEALARAKEALFTIARLQDAQVSKDGAQAEERLDAGALATLGDLVAALDDKSQAYAVYDAALKLDDANTAALAGLANLTAMEDDVVVSTALRRRLAQTLEEEDEKFRTLVASGDQLASAGKLELAVQAYEEARAVRPNDRPILHVLLGHYTTLERWDALSGVLRAVAEGDDDKARKAKTVATIAQIAQEKLGDEGAAVVLNDEALDLDPSRLECFERLVTILTARKDWAELEAAYRRMLFRALGSGDAKLQFLLYHQAGLVARDRLGDREGAIRYFRAAAELRPDDAQVQAILRELLEITGQIAGAVQVALARVQKDPHAADGYAPLVELLLQVGDVDRAWLATSAMDHLGVLGPAHSPFYRKHPPMPLADMLGNLSENDAWRAILHPELDPRLTAIFEILAPAAIELHLSKIPLLSRMQHPGPTLPKPKKAGTMLQFFRGIEIASAIFGITPPKLYVNKTVAPLLAAGSTRPPSLLVNQDSVDATPEELVPFLVGKRVFELAPPLLARAICPAVSELSALVAMGVNAVVSGAKDEPLRAHLDAAAQTHLAGLFAEARAAGGELDVKRWSHLADLSTSRAGLLLVGDMKLARSALAREAQTPGDLPLRDQLRELLVFLLSDTHAMLRKQLGVALRTDALFARA